ncbi:low affinity iron permease family protein [Pseudomonas sp. R2.Fl]|nr:low affinity iron permease family protein [Pseudomonas sp. R2.Fl]
MSGISKHFSSFASAVSSFSGKPVTFVAATAVVVVWAISGPFFGFSETWQLVINTGTTIITFLMVFVLQNAQTRDTEAMQAKLDELILTSRAENRFVGIEKLDEGELKRLSKLLRRSAKENGENGCPPVAEARERINAELQSRQDDRSKKKAKAD